MQCAEASGSLVCFPNRDNGCIIPRTFVLFSRQANDHAILEMHDEPAPDSACSHIVDALG